MIDKTHALKRFILLARRSGIGALAALLSAGALPARAEGAEAFRAKLVSHEVIGFDPVNCPAPPFLLGRTTGSGTSSHLGTVGLASSDCITPGATSFTFTGGKLVLKAANGDMLTADYSGLLLPTANAASFAMAGSYRVTGGSGRFDGATGAGQLQGSIDIVSGDAAYSAAGTLTLAPGRH